MSNSFLALSNTRFTNGGNGRTLVECVLLERISEKSARNSNIKTNHYKRIFYVCFFIILDTLSTLRQSWESTVCILSNSNSCMFYWASHHVTMAVVCDSKQPAEKSLSLHSGFSNCFMGKHCVWESCVFSKVYFYNSRQAITGLKKFLTWLKVILKDIITNPYVALIVFKWDLNCDVLWFLKFYFEKRVRSVILVTSSPRENLCSTTIKYFDVTSLG